MMKTKRLVWNQVDKSKIRLDSLVEEYLLVCRTEGKSPKTLRGYREKLGRFCRWLDGNLSDFNLQAVRAYVSELQRAMKFEGHPYSPVQDKGLSSVTIKGHVVVIKGFATWLYEEEYTNENVLARLRPPKATRKVMATLSETEINIILSSVEQDTLSGYRNTAVILLFLDTGLRCAELVGLRMDDLFLADQCLKVMGKGQKERIVPFGDRTARALLRYLNLKPQTNGCNSVFLNRDGRPFTENALKMVFERLAKKAGIPRLHIHLLRHTMATNYLLSGENPIKLQRIMAKLNSLDFGDDCFTRLWIWRPLHHIPKDLQTPSVKARLSKLDSQFGPYSYHPPIRTTGVHTVGSPVPKSEIEKMEPEVLYEFLIANRDLKGSWVLEKDIFLGGAEELASEATKVLIEDLDKYRQIVEKLASCPENDIYLERFLGGLWEKEIKSTHLEWLGALIARVWKRDKLQLEIARFLQKMVEVISRKQFDNLKPILISLSTSATDPEKDLFFEYRRQGYSNDALGEGINSTRGAMCEAILRALIKFQDVELVPVLEKLAEDETISVRASLVYYLPLGLKPLGWDVCFGLFGKASQKGLEEYAEVAGRFLQYVPDSEIQTVEALLDSWFETKVTGLEGMVMSLAAIYYLRNLLSYDKIYSWFTDGKIQRESKEEALGILANHIQYQQYAEKVISIFDSLLDSEEQTVGKSINNLFLRARPDDFHKLQPIIEEVAKRPAIRGPALYDILNYLEKCLLVDAPSCFEILEMLLNAAGDDFYNFRDFVPAAHSKVPLAILNTIFECYFELEDRALKVLDKLIELRWAGVDEYLKAAERL